MNETSAAILTSIDQNGIATVTLNRPEKRNCVTLAMWQRLSEIFTDWASKPEIRVVILTGNGGIFCAGADISEFAEVRSTRESARIYEGWTEAAARAIRDFPRPTIAAISGFGVGGGCGLALSCDFRVADETARMGIPAARLGIVYNALDCDLLRRQVGIANAKRVLFSGKFFPLADCIRMGLVDIPAEGTDALSAARYFAEEFVNSAPLTVSGTKFILESLSSGLAREREEQILTLMDQAIESADYKEGGRAFLEKRKPVFVGR